MSIKNRTTIIVFVLLIVVISITFTINQKPSEYGTVQGQVKIGPLCPQEPCNKVQNLTGYSLAFTSNGKDFSYAPLSADGNFSIRLKVGSYTVTMAPSCQWMGCSREFPKSVTVAVNGTTVLNISIDTGIR
jgi:hypothetical protein